MSFQNLGYSSKFRGGNHIILQIVFSTRLPKNIGWGFLFMSFLDLHRHPFCRWWPTNDPLQMTLNRALLYFPTSLPINHLFDMKYGWYEISTSESQYQPLKYTMHWVFGYVRKGDIQHFVTPSLSTFAIQAWLVVTCLHLTGSFRTTRDFQGRDTWHRLLGWRFSGWPRSQ